MVVTERSEAYQTGARQISGHGTHVVDRLHEPPGAVHFPEPHRRRLASTNPLERLHKEIKQRTYVIGIHPNRDALLRIVGMVLAEQDDEWAVADRRYFSQESMDRFYAPEEGGEAHQELVKAIP
ncbi:MAG: hypothetical protein KatS3mg011_0481 [Acidimicrobiia bacterium]|nr:MAG: hypothetical protein KatS3mg011_0481 [Acidimicrobiia bacterium]